MARDMINIKGGGECGHVNSSSSGALGFRA